MTTYALKKGIIKCVLNADFYDKKFQKLNSREKLSLHD